MRIATVPDAEWIERVGPVAGVEMRSWDMSTPLPDPEIGYAVHPYLTPAARVAAAGALPGERVVQLLTAGYDGLAGKVGGASRFPNGVDTDAIADWMRNDFERAGLPTGSLATQTALEALNTPGMPNTIRVADFYRHVDASSSTTLRATLHAAIDDHIKVPYTSAETDTWDVLNLADEDPVDTGAILDLYKNAVYTKIAGGTGAYNREHSWPNSYGFPNDGATNFPYTDCHHLFAADVTYNADRGNLPYGTCASGCSEDATLLNHGIGGGSGTYPGNSNWYSTSAWETWNARRGDVARAQLYLEVRYEGGTHGATGATEPDLRLTDDTGLIVTTGGNASVAYMGRLTTILAWAAQDPVDAREQRRNDVVYTYQANRNPFVDHPEWVACLWNNQCDTFGSGFADGFEVTLDCPNNRYINDEEICIALAGMWAQLKIKVKVNAQPRATYFPKIEKQDTSLYMLGWGGAITDAETTFTPVLRNRGEKGVGYWNFGGVKDDKFDALAAQSSVEPDAKKREGLIKAALREYKEQVHVIPLHRQVIPWAARSNVSAVHRADNWLEVQWVTVGK